MAFAEMELSAETLIWDLTGISWDDGKLLTRMDARPKFELARTLCARYGVAPSKNDVEINGFWKQITRLRDERNKIVHAAWMMFQDKLPLAASYRLPAKLGRATGEGFPIPRLQNIARECREIKGIFDRMADQHIESPQAPSEPSPKKISKNPPNRSNRRK